MTHPGQSHDLTETALRMGSLVVERDALVQAIADADSDERQQLEERREQIAVELLDSEIALMQERLRVAVAAAEDDPAMATQCHSLAAALEQLHAERAQVTSGDK